LSGLLFGPEGRDDTLLRNVGGILLNYTVVKTQKIVLFIKSNIPILGFIPSLTLRSMKERKRRERKWTEGSERHYIFKGKQSSELWRFLCRAWSFFWKEQVGKKVGRWRYKEGKAMGGELLCG
jgi:hypothetical protein